MTDPAIRTVDKAALAGIIATGKPAGLWLCRSTDFPRLYTGVDARNGKPVLKKHGAFPDVLSWLMGRGKILPRTVKNRIRGEEVFRGIRATRDGFVRLAPEAMKTAPRYHGFTVSQKREPSAPKPKAAPKVSSRIEEARKRDAEIVRLYRDGVTAVQIAEELGQNSKTIQKRMIALRKNGTLPPVHRGEKGFDRSKAAALRDAGYSREEIAEALGCSVLTAYRILKELAETEGEA